VKVALEVPSACASLPWRPGAVELGMISRLVPIRKTGISIAREPLPAAAGAAKERMSNFDEQSHYVVENKGSGKRTKPNKPKFRRWENPAKASGDGALPFEFFCRLLSHLLRAHAGAKLDFPSSLG